MLPSLAPPPSGPKFGSARPSAALFASTAPFSATPLFRGARCGLGASGTSGTRECGGSDEHRRNEEASLLLPALLLTRPPPHHVTSRSYNASTSRSISHSIRTCVSCSCECRMSNRCPAFAVFLPRTTATLRPVRPIVGHPRLLTQCPRMHVGEEHATNAAPSPTTFPRGVCGICHHPRRTPSHATGYTALVW